MRGILSLSLLLILSFPLQAQVIPSSAYERLEAFKKRNEARDTSWFRDLHFENIGPTVFSGRVTGIEVNPKNPWEFYVAYASGGLWYTRNNGVSFTPFFQQEAVMTIGAIAVDWANGIVWIGTGEVNSSRSSYAGVGIYKGHVGKDHWKWVGLPESHHIGKILVHPRDSNRVSVAVMGPLYSKSSNRGVYQTRNGGKVWDKTLYVNDSTGCIDIIEDPANPDMLFAAMWQRDRKAWNFIEAGQGSGIFSTSNWGGRWDLLSTDSSGFPTGNHVGRIGLKAIRPDSQLIMYALLDNYKVHPAESNEDRKELRIEDFKVMDREAFLELDNGDLDDFLKKNNFPKEYRSGKIKEMVRLNEIKPEALADYLEDANMRLLNGKVHGAELYRSLDTGRTWQMTHMEPLDGVYNTYGYYFGLLGVSGKAPERIFIAGVPILRSDDGGKTFKNVNGDNVHVDHHALWINPERPEHMILGNDGGINISYDAGENWIKCNSPAVGQFYSIQTDLQKPFWVYGGTQDNGVWAGPHDYSPGTAWHSTGRYHYKSIMGGDGMQVQVDTRDHRYVYTGFQFGNYYRLDNKTGEREYITPKHELGERPYRWNWQTPIHLSVHNQDILYMGSNFVFRSMDQGRNFEKISPDLTTGGLPGDVPFGTLTTLHESPLQFGLIYAGSDDGLIYVTRDAGTSWTCLSNGLPPFLWVSRIQASAHKKSRVYLSLNGYRQDHFSAYVFRSEDYGQTWTRIGNELPSEPVNVIQEDPINEDILFVGTDHQVYVSVDRGQSFMSLSKNLPDVAIHDLIPHPREHKLILGTHGRSLYLVDIKRVRDYQPGYLEKELYWYPIDTVRYQENQGTKRNSYSSPRVDSIEIEAFCGMAGVTTFQVISQDGATLFGSVLDLKKGYNRWPYHFEVTERGVRNWKDLNPKEPLENGPFYEGQDGKWYLKKGEYELILRHETGLKLDQRLILKNK